MLFEISCRLYLSSFASEYHRMVENNQTYKWTGWLSLFDGMLRAPTVLIKLEYKMCFLINFFCKITK